MERHAYLYGELDDVHHDDDNDEDDDLHRLEDEQCWDGGQMDGL